MNITSALKSALRRPTLWTIDSAGSGGVSVGTLAVGGGILKAKWGAEDTVYSFPYAGGGTSIGLSLVKDVAAAASTVDMPGVGSRIFFLPGTNDAYLVRSQFQGPYAMISGDFGAGGAAILFLGTSTATKWAIRVASRALWTLTIPTLLSFKAIGFCSAMEAGTGAGVSLTMGEMWLA